MTDAATADAAPETEPTVAEPERPPYNEHPARPEDAEDVEDTAVADLPPPTPGRMAFDLERSRLTPGLVAAIARAQSDIQPVGKASRNEQGSRGGYDYASADDMIGELRRAFSRQGIAILSSHYMQEPPFTGPISTDAEGNATQWLDCTLKGTTLLTYCEPATREVGLLIVRWEQDAVGKRGTPNDKSQRAAETYALGFVSRGIGHMNRAVTPKDEDRDAGADDDGPRGGRGRGAKPAQQRREPEPQQGTQRRVTSGQGAPAAGKGAPASSVGGGGTDPLAGLRDSVVRRYTELGLQDWRKWGLVCKDAGLAAPVRVAEASAADLRKLHDLLEREQDALAKVEADAADKAAEGGSTP